MNTPDKVIKVADGEVGYLEKRSNYRLKSKRANAGYNNYTKYGKWAGMNGVYWCALYVCWCFWKAYGEDAKKILCGGYSASCEILRQQFIREGCYSQTPKKGGPIFFSGSRHSGANHIGIVTRVTDSYVYTDEGNTSGFNSVDDNGGCVASKCYARSNPRILGYGHPKFDKPAKSKKTSNKSKFKSKTVTAVHGLRLRKTSSLSGKILDVMPHGTKVAVIKNGTDWTKIRYNGKTGYCATRYLL